MSKLLRSFVS